MMNFASEARKTKHTPLIAFIWTKKQISTYRDKTLYRALSKQYSEFRPELHRMKDGQRQMEYFLERGPQSAGTQKTIPFHLITLDSLPPWIDPEIPLHPSFDHLSTIHRSDYLRCYFMHVHGGGYTDIKQSPTP